VTHRNAAVAGGAQINQSGCAKPLSDMPPPAGPDYVSAPTSPSLASTHRLSGARAPDHHGVLCPGEACVWDLNDAFDLSQPAISHHMKVLDEVGPVDRENAKRTLTVILNPAAT